MRANLIWIGVAAIAMGATAQTTTTVSNNNDGVSGAVPVYSGTSRLSGGGSSTVFQSGANVGIGTTAPSEKLDVENSLGHNGIKVGNGGGDYLEIFDDGNSHIEGAPGSILWINQDNNAATWIGGAGSNVVLNYNGKGNVGVGTGLVEHHFELVSNQGVGVNEWAPHGMVVVSAAPNIDGNSTMIWMDTDHTNNIGYIQAYQRGIGARPLVLQAGPGGSGNVGIGTTNPQAKLEVNGGLRFSGDAAGVVQTTAWTGVLCGGDYAEAVNVAGGKKSYEPGDVLALTEDGKQDVIKASEPYSTMVAGIYATKPGVIGRRQSLLKDSDDLPMAMVGIVPTKVSTENGAIHRGDLLVSSSTPGYAMKGTDRSRMLGAVIGKAMGSLDSGTGVVDVLVTLQ